MNPIPHYRSFFDLPRVDPGYRPVPERVRDWNEVEKHLAPDELARQAAATERAREVRRRFLGTGTPYTPQSVNFYNN